VNVSVCSKIKKKPAWGAGLVSFEEAEKKLRRYLFDGRAASLWEGQRHHRPPGAREREEISQVISAPQLSVRARAVNRHAARRGSGRPVHKQGKRR
jgi:hypothetical protein